MMQTARLSPKTGASLASGTALLVSRMATETSSEPTRALAIAPASSASHADGDVAAPAGMRAWVTTRASTAPRASWPTLKTIFAGVCSRLRSRTSSEPSVMPISRSAGRAKARPSTSGISPSVNVWELRRTRTCTAQASAPANARARAHQGTRTVVSGAGSAPA